MCCDKLVLGIDTSNYKTSLAVTCGRTIEADLRTLLDVKKGDRGLRQSEALFQHVKNLPVLFSQLGSEYTDNIEAVAYSSRPRPVEGSYMPCFLAGESLALSLGAMLGIPVKAFSHQEGHIEAVKKFSTLQNKNDFLACHFSGGTCDVLRITEASENTGAVYDIEAVGGSLDISFGQVLDRAGVAMGMEFPCGEKMDSIALCSSFKQKHLTPIKVREGRLNLSGTDTQIKNIIGSVPDNELACEIFTVISASIGKMLEQACSITGVTDVLMAGGVSSSRFIRRELSAIKGITVHFDDNNLSSDNAVGIALLGGRV